MRLRADLTLCSCLHLFPPPSRDYNTSARSNVSTRAHWVRLKRTAKRIEKKGCQKKGLLFGKARARSISPADGGCPAFGPIRIHFPSQSAQASVSVQSLYNRTHR